MPTHDSLAAGLFPPPPPSIGCINTPRSHTYTPIAHTREVPSRLLSADDVPIAMGCINDADSAGGEMMHTMPQVTDPSRERESLPLQSYLKHSYDRLVSFTGNR